MRPETPQRPTAPAAPRPTRLGQESHPEVLAGLWRALARALHVLLAGLAIFVVVRDPRWQVCCAVALFAAVYASGYLVVGPGRRGGRPRRRTVDVPASAGQRRILGADAVAPVPGDELGTPGWPALLWLAGVCLSWFALSVVTMDAAFLVFPLFFVVVRFLRPAVSAVVVGILTVATVALLSWRLGADPGALVGPVIGAGVAWVLGVGYRALYAEAIARAAAMEDLVAARAQALDLSRRAGEMDERARLAGDIHDTVAQGLSSIHMLLSAAERGLTSAHPEQLAAVSQHIALAKRTASDNLAETRRIIAALQPAPLAGADLPVALARICSATPGTHEITFDIDGTPRPLGDEVEAALVRITQSLVSNVVRHAHAPGRVTLTYQPQAVLVDVVDRGAGFEARQWQADGTSTLGLSGVWNRARALGGTMTLESAPGSGTGVSVAIPAATQTNREEVGAQ